MMNFLSFIVSCLTSTPPSTIHCLFRAFTSQDQWSRALFLIIPHQMWRFSFLFFQLFPITFLIISLKLLLPFQFLYRRRCRWRHRFRDRSHPQVTSSMLLILHIQWFNIFVTFFSIEGCCFARIYPSYTRTPHCLKPSFSEPSSPLIWGVHMEFRENHQMEYFPSFPIFYTMYNLHKLNLKSFFELKLLQPFTYHPFPQLGSIRHLEVSLSLFIQLKYKLRLF